MTNETADQELQQIIEEEREAGAMVAEIYSKPNCPYCVRAKKILLDRGGYTLVETSAVDTREALIERVTEASGQPPRTVPQIFINGEYVGGHDDLVARFAAEDEGRD